MKQHIVNGLLVAIAVFLWIIVAQQWSLFKPISEESSIPDESLGSFATIQYRGHTVKLKRVYSDYEEYEDDDDNIAPSDIPQVQQLVQTAPIARQFTDVKQMTLAVSSLRFPGWGWMVRGLKQQTDGTKLTLFGISIPYTNKIRYLLFRATGPTCTLIDDFVHSDSDHIESATFSDDSVRYSMTNSSTVLERKLTSE